MVRYKIILIAGKKFEVELSDLIDWMQRECPMFLEAILELYQSYKEKHKHVRT